MTIKTRLTAARKWIAGVVLSIAAALGIYVNAQAPVYQVSLTLPNQYTDNSTLPLSAITSYSIAYKLPGATEYTVKVVNGPFTQANQSTTTPKQLGQTCFNAFVNVGAVASAATSPDVCPTFTGPPKAPTNLTVQ